MSVKDAIASNRRTLDQYYNSSRQYLDEPNWTAIIGGTLINTTQSIFYVSSCLGADSDYGKTSGGGKTTGGKTAGDQPETVESLTKKKDEILTRNNATSIDDFEGKLDAKYQEITTQKAEAEKLGKSCETLSGEVGEIQSKVDGYTQLLEDNKGVKEQLLEKQKTEEGLTSQEQQLLDAIQEAEQNLPTEQTKLKQKQGELTTKTSERDEEIKKLDALNSEYTTMQSDAKELVQIQKQIDDLNGKGVENTTDNIKSMREAAENFSKHFKASYISNPSDLCVAAAKNLKQVAESMPDNKTAQKLYEIYDQDVEAVLAADHNRQNSYTSNKNKTEEDNNIFKINGKAIPWS